MIYSFLSFFQLVKKQYLLVFGLYIGSYIILYLTTMGFYVDINNFNTLLGCPPYNSPIQILWTIFQFFCHIYIVFTFLSYEQDSSFEYMILRESYKKTTIKKFLLILLVTILLRIIVFFVTYLFFYNIIKFPFVSFIYNIGIYIIITIIVCFLFILVKNNK